MPYINTQTNEYPVYEQDIRNTNPNTSFPTPFVAPEEYAPVLNSPTPEYESLTQGVREIAPTLDDLGNWIQVFEVYDLEPEQVAYNEEQRKQSNKTQAEQLLKDTDWTQMPDVYLVNKSDFTTYRHEIRLIALNPPVTVTEWPTKPTEQWSE